MNVDAHSLGTAFSVWAAVVGMMGGAIVWELARLRKELKAMSDRLNGYILNMERRVTTIEAHLSHTQSFRPLEWTRE